MTLVLCEGTTEEWVHHIKGDIRSRCLEALVISGAETTTIQIIGKPKNPNDLLQSLESYEAVREVFPVSPSYRKIRRNGPIPYPDIAAINGSRTLVRIGDVEIGGMTPVAAGGPCSVKDREQTLTIANFVAEAGAKMLRGGSFKPRTSRRSWQGL